MRKENRSPCQKSTKPRIRRLSEVKEAEWKFQAQTEQIPQQIFNPQDGNDS